MNINIKAITLELTPDIKEYAERKIQALDKFLKRLDEKGAINVRMEIVRTTEHHQKGDIYCAQAIIDLPKGILRAQATSSDIRSAIDEMHLGLKREVEKYSDIKETKFRRGLRKIKNILRGI